MPDAASEPATPYAVLARKYRSRTFDEVVGQTSVAGTLKKAIETGRVHHAYLFCGTRGVGKTSMARILALALNDPTTDAPTPTPDPTTETADAIFKGDDVDVIEIDAASNTGVDNVRDLIENARFRPMRSRFKVYIIDEVHMLSKAAFNALLKIMEEPPSHVKFILATTEPERVLPTILSRVQRFDFGNIPAQEIVGHLQAVVEHEGRQADDAALRLVARSGAGSMRDSLSLLDRLLSGTDATATLDVESATKLLGLPPRQQVYELVDAIGRGDPKQTLGRADALLSGGQSTDTLTAALVDHLHALLVRSVAGGGAELADLAGLDEAELARQAQAFEPATLAQDVAILEELRRQMRSGGAGRALFDATLVRLSLAEQATPIGDLLAAATGQAVSTGQKKKPEPAVTAEPDEPSAPDLPDAEPEASNVEPVDAQDLRAVWSKLLGTIGRTHKTVAPLLEAGRIEQFERDGPGGRVKVVYPFDARMHVGLLDRNGKKEAVADVLGKLLGLDQPPVLDLHVLDPDPEPDAPLDPEPAGPAKPHPSDFTDTDSPSRPAPNAPPTDLDLEADPLVQAAIRELGARVVQVEDVDP
jgi:DNA polymerase-3 subunit gamma/tau